MTKGAVSVNSESMHADAVSVVSTFELPDVQLAVKTQACGAFAYLHLGHDLVLAQRALTDLTARATAPFGIAVEDAIELTDAPASLVRALLPWGTSDAGLPRQIERVWQVRTLDDATQAIQAGATALVAKGADAGGFGGRDSTFILFQQILAVARPAGVRLYAQGGLGVHTGAAYLALGAAGVLLDSQVALLPECSAPRALKDALGHLRAAKTTRVHGRRVLHWPSMPHPDNQGEATALLGGLDLEQNLIPAGQDIALAGDYLARYGTLRALVFALREAAYGHLRQAQYQARQRENGAGSAPIVQGPMARVSDTPAFLRAVSDAGALPTLALGVATPEQTAEMLGAARQAMDAHPWAAGLLGFIAPDDFDAQANVILGLPQQDRPTAVIIAGGRPAQGKRFEQAGIQAFLHAPTAAALDKDLDGGARRFIFEGRESGGHVGPLHSTVLWEQQLARLIDVDDADQLCVLFAGGIHDAWTAAFVDVMAASLVARGAQVGLQLGTAYLLTREAVTTGAITQIFQDLALAADRTVLLESAPGQETRALPTPFIDAFTAEKARIEADGMEPMAQRMRLEQLNLGRARVAAKGLDRSPDTHELVRLDGRHQITDGLYMAGSLVALHRRSTTMAGLHQAVTTDADTLLASVPEPVAPDIRPHAVEIEGADPRPEPIAIIGMAGMFPDAQDVDGFWSNILMGHDSVTLVPASRWDTDLFYRADPPTTDFPVSKWGAFLSPTAFDPVEFGIPPKAIGSIEPAQLLSLLVAKRALEDAGYADAIRDGLFDTSVIMGAQAAGELASAYGTRPGFRRLLGDLPEPVDTLLPRPDEDSFPGILSNVVSGRIANRLNCDGRNFTVDAACASSLASLDVACQELWTNRARMVLCGGVDLHNSIFDYVMFSATHALSPRGYCATFDESGDGLDLGEGVGVVVLKRLSDAERDGDRIYALVRGIEGSSDGRSLGLTAPNRAGQIKALQRTYRQAGILPSQVGLVEAHGTGTAVGDRTELTALTNVMLDAGALPGDIWLGSVKSQIGHAKCAAGVAGLIRTALCVRHGIIPPTLHLEHPVRPYCPQRSPFAFNANGHATPWWSAQRTAGLSGFGFGGTNFHVIVQNYQETLPVGPTASTWSCELFCFRGDTPDQARTHLAQVVALAGTERRPSLKDVAYTLATESDADIQFCIVAGDWDRLRAGAQALLDGIPAPGTWARTPVSGKVAFLFSGQGSQRVGMARDLFTMFGWLRQRPAHYPGLTDIWFPPTAFTDQGRAEQNWTVTDTRNSEPLLALADLAIAELLTWFGIDPDMLAGHSFGELPALAYAGALPDEALADLSRARADAILGAVGDDPGAMIAINQPADLTQQLVAGRADVWPVNFNAPTQVVVAGTTPAIEALAADCDAAQVPYRRLDVACAFHTPLLEGSDLAFYADLARIDFSTPAITVWSNTTAEPYPTQPGAIRERLAAHLVNPVRFSDELRAMHADGARIFLEAGPGGVLTGLAGKTLPDAVTIRTCDGSADGLRTFLSALAQYAATGRTIDVARLFEHRHAARIDLDAAPVFCPTTWMVDGLEAVPIATWRACGNQHPSHTLRTSDPDPEIPDPPDPTAPQPTPLQGDISMTDTTSHPAPSPTGPAPAAHDQLVYAYLQNMRAMLDDQRDVLLTALGSTAPGAVPASWDLPPLAPVPAPAYVPPTPVAYVPPAPAAPAPQPAPAAPQPAPAAPAPRMGLAAQLAGSAAPAAPAAASVPASGASTLPTLDDLDADQLKDIIVGVVSEKTGYPVDMLGMDMDLEADLSIDSIKRLEIMGALGEKIDLTQAQSVDADTTQVLETLSNIRTLQGMVEWLQSMAEQTTSGTPASPQADKTPAPANTQVNQAPAPASPQADKVPSPFDSAPVEVPDAATPTAPAEATLPGAAATAPSTPTTPIIPGVPNVPVARLTYVRSDYPFQAAPDTLAGLTFLVTDGTLSDRICDELAVRGAQSRLIHTSSNPPMPTAPATTDRPGPADGLIFVRTPGSDWDIHDLFDLLKLMDLSATTRIVLCDDTLATLAHSHKPDVTALQGFTGFLKSLRMEYPDIRCTMVHGLTPFADMPFASMLMSELVQPTKWPEVMYDNGTRVRYTPIATAVADHGCGLGGLDEACVSIALGGAQGISPVLIGSIAAQAGGRFVLVGRTARDPELVARYADCTDADQIQHRLIHEEHMTDPREVAPRVRTILKARSIEDALRLVTAAGAQASYASLDLRNPDAFRALVDQVRREFGRVDAIFHAAGVLEDKLLDAKTWDSFQRVYTTKTAPLPVIGELLDEVRLVVLFSSVSAAGGNAGQCDYAAANSVLDTAAGLWSSRGYRAQIVSIAWGPWRGKGMVSPGLEAELGRQGLTLIPTMDGRRAFLAELADGADTNVILMGGDPAKAPDFIAKRLGEAIPVGAGARADG